MHCRYSVSLVVCNKSDECVYAGSHQSTSKQIYLQVQIKLNELERNSEAKCMMKKIVCDFPSGDLHSICLNSRSHKRVIIVANPAMTRL